MEAEYEVDYSLDEEEGVKEDPDAGEAAEDIYADLYDEEGAQGTILKSKNAALQEQCQQQEATIENLRGKIQELTDENAALSDERKILIRNISCLYRTAREEMHRKDVELRKRAATIEQLTSQIKSSRGPHHPPVHRSPLQPRPLAEGAPPPRPHFHQNAAPRPPTEPLPPPPPPPVAPPIQPYLMPPQPMLGYQ